MRVSFNISHGPIDIDIEADDGDEYQEEILKIAEFLVENEEEMRVFNTRNPETEAISPALGGNIPKSKDDSAGVTTRDVDGPTTDGDSVSLAPLSSITGISQSVLESLIFVDPEGERLPHLIHDDPDDLGEKEISKKRKGALVLLLTFHKCYDEDRVSSSDLKESFILSGIPEENINKSYEGDGKRLFDPTGRGGSATVALRGPGEREAVKVIKALAETIEPV